MLRVEVEIEGRTPLLMNRMSPEALEGLRTKAKAPKSKTQASQTPREQAESHVYKTKDGVPYLPVENLLSCLIAAGVFIRLDGKRQMSTGKSTTVPGLFEIEESWLPLSSPAENGTRVPLSWDPDIRQGRNPNGGEAVCIVRPRFDRWAATLTICVDTEQIDEAKIRELFDIAGKRIGLGDFRPQRKGIFGKFNVARWSRLDAIMQAAE